MRGSARARCSNECRSRNPVRSAHDPAGGCRGKLHYGLLPDYCEVEREEVAELETRLETAHLGMVRYKALVEELSISTGGPKTR